MWETLRLNPGRALRWERGRGGESWKISGNLGWRRILNMFPQYNLSLRFVFMGSTWALASFFILVSSHASSITPLISFSLSLLFCYSLFTFLFIFLSPSPFISSPSLLSLHLSLFVSLPPHFSFITPSGHFDLFLRFDKLYMPLGSLWIPFWPDKKTQFLRSSTAILPLSLFVFSPSPSSSTSSSPSPSSSPSLSLFHH